MIKYALKCSDCSLEYEAWFSDSGDYDSQKERGLVSCPGCDSRCVTKAIMSPAVTSKTNQRVSFRQMARETHRYLEQHFENVGSRFAEEALAMSEGRSERRGIYGELDDRGAARLDEAGVEYGWVPAKPRDDA